MDDIHSSIGLVQLDKIVTDLNKRTEVRKLYVKLLSEIPGIIIPFRDYTEFSSNYILPIVLKDGNAEKRDQIRAALAEEGIQTSMHYPAVHRFSIYKEFYRDLPVTDYLVDNLITLPMYSKLTGEQVHYICNTLKKLL
jgi:dTDP-4-amino-4,6-dideoxygalactose transaminase